MLNATKRRSVFALLAAACAVSLPGGALQAQEGTAPSDEDAWVSLFNGKDLTGWIKRGDAKWTIRDGVLVGEQNDGKVGDLFTTTEWRDFEVTVRYKVRWPANTGVWFRSQPEKKKLGYQMDILSLKDYGATTGSIWSKGFLAKNMDESIEKRDDWNLAQITAVGPKLTVVLNGNKVAEATDTQYTVGRIGFQVHGGDKYKDMAVMVKEVKLRRR
ncbi:MAG: DUF1080 domain-containing protein [Armatimonadota bacterium]|jgi:hypothetical protein